MFKTLLSTSWLPQQDNFSRASLSKAQEEDEKDLELKDNASMFSRSLPSGSVASVPSLPASDEFLMAGCCYSYQAEAWGTGSFLSWKGDL